METHVQLEPVSNDRHQHVDGNGDPDLTLHRVLRSAEERLYSQVLLNPLKKQFHPPSRTIQLCDGQWRQDEVVGEEHQCLFGRAVEVFDAAQLVGIVLRRRDAVRHHDLVADDPRRSVDLPRVEAPELRVPLCPEHEVCRVQVQRVETGEVEIGAVHDVEGSRLRGHDVEDVDVVEPAFGDVNECGDVAAQVEERVQLDGRLGLPEPRPRKERQAQVDRGGIERVDRVVEIEAVAFLVIQAPRRVDEVLRERGVEPPVPDAVGVGKRVSRHAAADAHVIELARLGTQAGLDVAQARPVGQLGKRHAPVLIAAGERLDLAIALVLFDEAVEPVPWKVIHDLSENELPGVHGQTPF